MSDYKEGIIIFFGKLTHHFFLLLFINCLLWARLGAKIIKKMVPLLKLFIDKLNLCPVFPGSYIFRSVIESNLLRRLLLFSNVPSCMINKIITLFVNY